MIWRIKQITCTEYHVYINFVLMKRLVIKKFWSRHILLLYAFREIKFHTDINVFICRAYQCHQCKFGIMDSACIYLCIIRYAIQVELKDMKQFNLIFRVEGCMFFEILHRFDVDQCTIYRHVENDICTYMSIRFLSSFKLFLKLNPDVIIN